MIELYKDIDMTTKIDRLEILQGTGAKDSFILSNPDVWKLCVADLKETRYSITDSHLELIDTPGPMDKIIAIPSTATELLKEQSNAAKVYSNVIYVYTPTPIAPGVMLKLEHDYPEVTAQLSFLGSAYSTCVECAPTSEGPWPLSIQIHIYLSSDIRLFSDMELCAMSIDNLDNSSVLDMNTDGEVDLCEFTSLATQTRRVRIYEL